MQRLGDKLEQLSRQRSALKTHLSNLPHDADAPLPPLPQDLDDVTADMDAELERLVSDDMQAKRPRIGSV